MHTRSFLAGVGLILPSLVSAAPSMSLIKPRQNSSCAYDSSADPTCWGDYSLSTNYYNEAPDTGVTREYWFELTNTTAAPDGVERIILAINGSVPGPTIYADWGDEVVVHLTNSVTANGTSMHFHGVRQLNTNPHDGVASVTQCPAAPGNTTTYRWKATQYGTSWYHSHYSLQAWNGFFGGIQINGPHSAPYDEDLGVLMLSDWSHQTTDALYESAQTSGPPTLDNGLINGTNKYGDLGSYFETNFVAGKRYRLRLVNTAIDTFFKFSIDNHTLTVISSDFVPITPFNTSVLGIGIAQRYDVIVEANQGAGDFWLRAIPQLSCSTNSNTLNIKGIIRYDSSSTADPADNMWSYTDDCDDVSMDDLVPYLAVEAGSSSVEDTFDAGIEIVNGLFKWTLNENTFLTEWGYPTIEKVLTGNDTWTAQENIVKLPGSNEWVYFIIQNEIGVTHPIHLHGHDFWVLAQGSGTYEDGTVTLKTTDAPRRDVAMLPASGYLVIAFLTDNPGVWLMHCHIGWHASEGLALQLIERQDEIAALYDANTTESACTNWNAYQTSANLVQDDSGI